MIPKWCAKYVGIPFKDCGRDQGGCDCWGLVRLVLGEQFGLALPSFARSYRKALDGGRISQICAQEKIAWRPVTRPLPGDVALLLIRGMPWHIGIVVQAPWMLHVERGADAVMERYDNLVWRNKIDGFYRYNH